MTKRNVLWGEDAMRIHFQQRPWDLYIIIAYTLLIAAILLIVDVGNLLAILLILFVPGYVVVAALFPGGKEIDWIERTVLSVGLSIAVVPLLGLFLNFTPWGIRFAPIVATIVGFTLLFGLSAHWRRMRLPESDRLAATLVIGIPDWKVTRLVDRILSVALVISILIAAATLAYILLTPRPGTPSTEFYLLGPGGNASGYPTNLTPSEPGTVLLGVVNHETTANYAIRVDLVGVNLAFNDTCSCNLTQELNRTTLSWFNQSIGHGQNWSQRYAFTINTTGLWKLQFLLFKGDDFSTPYRETHLFIRVS